jgi:hypothetical protein
MLFDFNGNDRLILCIDPANVDLMRDFASDRSNVKLLEVECDFTDDYLIGHARRVGLAGDKTPRDVIDRLLPTIRYDVKFESDRIWDADFSGLYRIREAASPAENAVALAQFLDIPMTMTPRTFLPVSCAVRLPTRPRSRPRTHWPFTILPRKRRCMCW